MLDVDPKGALAAIDRAQAREIVQPELLRALEQLVKAPDALRLLDVLHAMRPTPTREGMRDESELLEDRELLRAVAFRVGMEAYRRDPTVPEAAGAVAAGLQEFGMAEASPSILIEAVRAHPDPRTLGAALAIVMQAMSIETEAENHDAARRTFRAAAPLLALGDDPQMAGKLQPSAARVRGLMGEIELRQGRIAEARALFADSAKTEKSGIVLLSLARIERHAIEHGPAIAHLKEALTAADTQRNPALRGEILLTLSDVTREQGDASGARPPLVDALKELTRARNAADSDDRARVERVLARVLDRFGADKPAQRALERALQAAPRDKQQVAATLTQQVGRALVRADLTAARDGLTRGLAADLPSDEILYLALWTRLLEKQLKQPSDGTAQRVFQSIPDDGRWTGRLAAFGMGKIKGDELLATAKTPMQKGEAQFYAALERKLAGDAKGAEEGLKQVVTGPGLELMEAALAREILHGPSAQLSGPLPQDVVIP
jgi:tetratricopeptide (TPR) repeat protein